MARPKIYDDELRQALITEGAKMLARGGAETLSLRVLARKAGTSTNAVYTFFGSKDSLIHEIAWHIVDQFATAERQRPAVKDPVIDLQNVLTIYRSIAQGNPAVYQTLTHGVVTSAPDGDQGDAMGADVRRALGRALLEPMHRDIVPLIEAGILRHADPEHIASTLWIAVHGFVSLEIAGYLDASGQEADGLFKHVLRAALSGWAEPAYLASRVSATDFGEDAVQSA